MKTELMKNKIFLWILCLPLALAITSCKDDDDDYSEWKETNEAAFNAIVSNPAYQSVTTPEGPGAVYVKKLKNGTGAEKPIYTSKVNVHYKGTLYDGAQFDASPDGVASSFSVNGVVSGFAVALQNMVVGDKWEVWIPWNLGYGSPGLTDRYGNQVIAPYSTLVFEVEMVSFEKYP